MMDVMSSPPQNPAPGPVTLADSAVEREALEHVWIHTASWIELAERRGLHVFDRGEGCRLYDVHGRMWIDGLSGLWVVNAGHGRREIAEAMAAQAARLAYVSSASFTSVASVQLAETLARLTPGDLDRIFFCSGGSEAVESAIKIARQAQVLRGFPGRHKIIARRGSYHGMTHGAMSVTAYNRGNHDRFFGPPMSGVSLVPSPNEFRNDFDVEGEAGDLLCARFVEQEILVQGPEMVAAVIAEPISISNGVQVPSPRYWQALREICDRHGVLLIMDEVINGFGRTGRWFAAEHFGVVPDIMTMAKGLSSGYAPIGAVAVRASVYEIFKQGKNVLNHLLTFGGQAVAAAAALKNLEIIEREELVGRAAALEPYLQGRLRALVDAHPTVAQARGRGLLGALQLVKDKASKQVWEKDSPFVERVEALLVERGLLTRCWGILHVAPPLVVTREEIDLITSIIDDCLTTAEREFALG
jgi:adenosylmethionine-8-amino-7-oxononanoate aminotransferase